METPESAQTNILHNQVAFEQTLFIPKNQQAEAEVTTANIFRRIANLGSRALASTQDYLFRASHSFSSTVENATDKLMPSRHNVARLAGVTLALVGLGASLAPITSDARSHRKNKVAKIANITGTIDTSNAGYNAAETAFQSDPFRQTPWAGDHYPNDKSFVRMFSICTPGTSDTAPWQGVSGFPPTFKYNKHTGVLSNVTFKSKPYSYCDLMGTTTETIKANLMFTHNGHLQKGRQIGQTIVYTDGQREVLASYMSANSAKSYVLKTLAIQGIGNVCRGMHGKPIHTRLVEVTDARHFQGNKAEDFQHLEIAGFVGFGGYSGTHNWSTNPKDVC